VGVVAHAYHPIYSGKHKIREWQSRSPQVKSKNENRNWRIFITHVYSIITHNCQGVEATQVSSQNKWINKRGIYIQQNIISLKREGHFFSFFFYYSYAHTRLGSFLPPCPQC
jgi:hypothetical protein